MFWGMESGAGLWLFPGILTHGSGGGCVWVIPALLSGEHTLCQDREHVYRAGLGAIPGGSRLCPSAFLSSAHPHQAHNNVPRNIPRQLSLPSRCFSLPSFYFQPCSSLIISEFPVTFQGSAFPLPGPSPPLPPSAHPWSLSSPTTLPASLPSSQGMFPCAKAPGTAPDCSSQVTDWHFWGGSDLHNIHGQERATDGSGNPATPCSNGCNTENCNVTQE